ncbi:MAG: carotenoid oxygenase [Benniella sp.]|nr:MAG: carotenoid oxygenase [Benniella sp.]
MDEVPENEIIQMEDSSLVEAIGETRVDTGNGTTATVHPPANDTDYQDRSKESIAASVPFDDEDITFHKALRNATSTEIPKELSVQGTLPSWLNGFHYTLSPGIFDIKYPKMVVINGEPQQETRTFTFGHWFDNIPQVNQFAISGTDNAIMYRSTKPAHRAEAKIREHQGYLPNQPSSIFLTDTNQSVFARLLSTSQSQGKPSLEPCGASIGVIPPFNADGRNTIYCQNYANSVLELNANTLETGGVLTWDEVNPLFKGSQASPHSHFDPVTKELINFTMEHGLVSTQYHFFSITEKEPHGSLVASVTAKTSHVHTFAVTPRYIILVVSPLHPTDGGVKYSWGASILDAMAFKSSEPTFFYVISRVKQRHIATFKADAFFFFHHVNAFEDAADNVYLDFSMYTDDTIAHQLSLSSLFDRSVPPLTRPGLCRFELANVQAEAQRLDDYNAAMASAGPVDKLRGLMRRVSVNHGTDQTGRTAQENSIITPVATRVRSLPGVELPRINPIYHGLEYKYTWGIGLLENGDGDMYDCIMKLHVKGDAEPTVWSQKNCYPSEAVFVPPPVFDKDEDTGVIISVVYDAEANASFVLVLDAKDLKEKARAVLPQIVPLSFANGCFAPGDTSEGMLQAQTPGTFSDEETEEEEEDYE